MILGLTTGKGWLWLIVSVASAEGWLPLPDAASARRNVSASVLEDERVSGMQKDAETQRS